jgi:hypothetical protein
MEKPIIPGLIPNKFVHHWQDSIFLVNFVIIQMLSAIKLILEIKSFDHS